MGKTVKKITRVAKRSIEYKSEKKVSPVRLIIECEENSEMYTSRHYWNKEVDLDESLSWNRYLMFEKEQNAQYGEK